jgi:hypothetical protein
MKDIQNQIKGNGLRWFGHVKRMDEHRTSKSLLEMKMTRKRPRDRSRTWCKSFSVKHKLKLNSYVALCDYISK